MTRVVSREINPATLVIYIPGSGLLWIVKKSVLRADRWRKALFAALVVLFDDGLMTREQGDAVVNAFMASMWRLVHG